MSIKSLFPLHEHIKECVWLSLYRSFYFLHLYCFVFISPHNKHHAPFPFLSSCVFSQLASSIRHWLLRNSSRTSSASLSSMCTLVKCYCSRAPYWVSWTPAIIMISKNCVKLARDLFSRALMSIPFVLYWARLKSIFNINAQNRSFRKFWNLSMNMEMKY